MRDKHRLTQAAVEREKQWGEQVEAKLVSEAKKTGSTDDIVRPPPNLQGVVNSIVASGSPNGGAIPTNSRQVPAVAIDHRSSPEVNGVALHAGRKANNTNPAPAVPPRHRVSCYPLSRVSRLTDSKKSTVDIIFFIKNAKPNGAPLTPFREALAAINLSPPTSTASTKDTSLTESPSESSESQAKYVRPMHRKSNGQMVPVDAESVRSPPNQRPRPNPLTRDNRSRTPRRSEASPTATVTGSTMGCEQRAKGSSSNSLLRQGPLLSSGTAKNATANSIPYPSTETLNSTYDDRRRVFSCCHTM
ncbi:unnamed protein product [Taenia asiatica]|uniref:TPX2 domain-containing protein n=1 Tax=Taenia asiatica TaxID=60517 RepID=A0A0R3WCE9_TAEAS|nr:unnamed protein product [Taenia asiatica]